MRSMWWLALAGALVLMGCGSDSTGGGGITSGTLNGIAFTVVSGTVTQPEDDGPITAAAAGGTIVLDDSAVSFCADCENRISVIVEFQASDGGSLVVVVYAEAPEDFASALAQTLTRNDTSIGYRQFFGLDATPDDTGTFSPDPVDAGGSIQHSSSYVSGNDVASGNTSQMALWHPADSVPGDCEYYAGTWQSGNSTTGIGDRIALTLADVAVSDIALAGSLLEC